MILLHGFPENWRTLKHQIPALTAAGFAVLAPDLRGYSESDRPSQREAYHLKHLVADVAVLRLRHGPRTRSTWSYATGVRDSGRHCWSILLLDRLVILNAPHLDIYRRLARGLAAAPIVVCPVVSNWPSEWALARNFSSFWDLSPPAVQARIQRRRDRGAFRPWRSPARLTAALNWYRENAAPMRSIWLDRHASTRPRSSSGESETRHWASAT